MHDETLAALVRRHRDVEFCIRQQMKIDSSLRAHIAREFFGFSTKLPEAERAAAMKQTEALFKAVRAGTIEAVHDAAASMILMNDAARAPFDKIRTDNEKAMAKLARTLPAIGFVQGVKGFGELSFARIVATAGPLHNWRCHKLLCNRLGLGVYNGRAGSSWRKGFAKPLALGAEDWIAFGHSPHRNAMMFVISDTLFRQQWTGAAKAGNDIGMPSGPYGEIYLARRTKTMEEHPDWTPGHRRADALRIMVKALVRDLWRAWLADVNGPVEMREAA